MKPLRSWHSVQVFYYDESRHDELILDAVCPALDRIRSAAGGGHFVRHWKQGPHLRLEFPATDRLLADLVRPVVDETIGSYLRSHPSTVELDEAKLGNLHRQRAEVEQEHGPLGPLTADNSVVYRTHDPRLHVLKNWENAELLLDFHTASHPIATEALRAVRNGADRSTIALSLMFAAVRTKPRGDGAPATGFLSFRSHSEAFLARCPPTARDVFQHQFERNRDVLARRLAAVERTATGGPPTQDVPWLPDWIELLTRFRYRVAELLDAGLLSAALTLPGVAPAHDDSRPALPAWTARSQFHSMIWSNTPFLELMRTDHGFQCRRTILNLTYQLLARIGVVPAQRFLLCHLAANTVEERYGVSAFELVRGYVDDHSRH